MALALIAVAALFASLLTFLSGFGLGTILTPVFIIFFPADTAIAMTAAVLGAWLLKSLTVFNPIYAYQLLDEQFEVESVSLTIGILMVIFSILKLIPGLKRIQLGDKSLIPGGILSGFFGGLSGHQGALRTLFLTKLNLSKEAFIATGVSIACAVDLARITIYVPQVINNNFTQYCPYLLTGTAAAFLGAIVGRSLLKKITINFVQNVVATGIITLGLLLIVGIIWCLLNQPLTLGETGLVVFLFLMIGLELYFTFYNLYRRIKRENERNRKKQQTADGIKKDD